jgi:hypothetical protein
MEFAKTLAVIQQTLNQTDKEMAKQAHIPLRMMKRYLTGEAEPRYDKATEIISDLLGFSSVDLMYLNFDQQKKRIETGAKLLLKDMSLTDEQQVGLLQNVSKAFSSFLYFLRLIPAVLNEIAENIKKRIAFQKNKEKILVKKDK